MEKRKYVMKKMMTDFVIINLVINGFFYWMNFRKFEGLLSFNDIIFDLLFGLVMLGLLCTGIGFVNIKKDLHQGKINVDTFSTTSLHHFLPKNMILRTILIALATAIFSGIFFVLIPKAFGINHINHLIGFSIKVITAGIAASIIGYIVIDLSIKDYQQLKLSETENINTYSVNVQK